MLTCLYNGRFFDNDQDGYTEVEKRVLGKDKKLICPICNSAVYYNSMGKVISHFSHYPGTACDERVLKNYDFDNSIHDSAKSIFARWIKSRLPNAAPVKDRFFPTIRQLADVYFETASSKVAIEIQFKHITPERLAERHENYSKIGVRDIWIFVVQEKITPGSPYERLYYQYNNRELYYFNLDSGLFTYFKGLKSEKFDVAGVKLSRYISRECLLCEIGIQDDGNLVLPGWKDLYTRKLGELTNESRRQALKKRSFKSSIRQKFQNRLNYNAKRIIDPETGEILEYSEKEEHKKENSKSFEQLTLNIADNEYAFEQIKLISKGKKEYLNILCRAQSYEYEMTSHTDAGEFECFVCRDIGNPEKWYVIKVFSNGRFFTIKEW